MHKEVLRKAAEQLSGMSKGGRLTVAGREGNLDKNKFKTIEEKGGKVVFVDGGQCSIVEAPNFLLQFIRICAAAYNGKERVNIKKFEYYSLTTYEEGKFKTKLYNTDLEIGDIDSKDEGLAYGRKNVEIGSVGQIIRKILELEIMCQIGCVIDGIVVRDGDLEQQSTAEEKWISQLKKMDVMGLSKTTQSVTSVGGTANAMLLEEGPEGKWYYKHTENIGFVKLHEKSEHTFRVDHYGDMNLGVLALQAKDPIFYGYPYGLILADRFARVTNKEKEYLQMVFMHNTQDYKEIMKHVRSVDAHSILDNIG